MDVVDTDMMFSSDYTQLDLLYHKNEFTMVTWTSIQLPGELACDSFGYGWIAYNSRRVGDISK